MPRRYRYRMRQVGDDHWQMTKIDADNNQPFGVYNITGDPGRRARCDCPSRKQPCKHKKIVARFIRLMKTIKTAGAIYYDPKQNKFYKENSAEPLIEPKHEPDYSRYA